MHPQKAICSILAALLAVSAGSAQEFQIRARVDLVVVPFSVKGDDGELITGMEAGEFSVWEDGVEQTVEGFSVDPVPLSAAVVIDTGVAEESLVAIQESIPSIVFGFGPFDEVAVYRYDDRVVAVQDFTEDPEVLRASLDQLRELTPTSQFVEGGPVQDGPVINGIPVINTARVPTRRDKRVLHDAVYQAALALRDRPEDRRKIIVLISDGNDERSEQKMEDNVLFLIEYELQVYSIGLGVGILNRLAGQFNDTLDDYARLTGGDLYHVGTSQLQDTFPQVTEQARNQYVLTYISSNEAPRGRIVFRRIEVFSEGPYDIVHRAGYYQTP